MQSSYRLLCCSTRRIGGGSALDKLRFFSDNVAASEEPSTSSSSSSSSSGDGTTAKLWKRNTSQWAELTGCKQFTNKRDVMDMLEGVNYGSIEAILDVNLGLTDRWAVKFDLDTKLADEFKVFDERNRKSNQNISLRRAINFNSSLLPSFNKIDNTCIRLRLTQPAVGPSNLIYLFESYKLHPERPISVIYNGKRVDPQLLQKAKWSSSLYIVQFASALEAERAVFEKSFTVIAGVKTSFLWYDI